MPRQAEAISRQSLRSSSTFLLVCPRRAQRRPTAVPWLTVVAVPEGQDAKSGRGRTRLLHTVPARGRTQQRGTSSKEAMLMTESRLQSGGALAPVCTRDAAVDQVIPALY